MGKKAISREVSLDDKKKGKKRSGDVWGAFYYNPKMQKKRLRRKFSLDRIKTQNRRKYQSFLSCCADSRQLKVQLKIYQGYLQETWVGSSLLPSYLYISNSFGNVIKSGKIVLCYFWGKICFGSRKGRYMPLC